VSFRISCSGGFGTKNVIAGFAMLALTFGFAHQLPARAASLTSILLGAVATTAGIFIPNNVSQTGMTNNTVVGRTADGGIVYADGRVVYRNGDALYSSNGDGHPCGWTAGVQTRCIPTATSYYPRSYNGHEHGNHDGWYKAEHFDDADGNGYGNAKTDANGHGDGNGNHHGNSDVHGHHDDHHGNSDEHGHHGDHHGNPDEPGHDDHH
jgi:hypothetical protein